MNRYWVLLIYLLRSYVREEILFDFYDGGLSCKHSIFIGQEKSYDNFSGAINLLCTEINMYIIFPKFAVCLSQVI